VIARLRLPRLRGIEPKPARAYCEADRWSFDPRYTQGRCPICGWQPEAVATAPAWLAIANRLDWEMLGLLLFADVLVLLGLVVANAAGLLPHGLSLFGGGGAPQVHGIVASAPRTH
jgi:hypothetical protein